MRVVKDISYFTRKKGKREKKGKKESKKEEEKRVC